MGLTEQIYTKQEAQLESQLMLELCQLWHQDQKRITHYPPQANGVVESLKDTTECWETLAVE